MSIQINNGNRIILDGEVIQFYVTQTSIGTMVWSSSGRTVLMPHKRYNLTTSYGLNPGVAGLDQFEMDMRRVVAAQYSENLVPEAHHKHSKQVFDLVQLLKEATQYMTFDKGSAYISVSYMKHQDAAREKINAAITAITGVKS